MGGVSSSEVRSEAYPVLGAAAKSHFGGSDDDILRPEEVKSFDEAIDAVGGFGRHQLLVLALACQTYIACSMNMFMPVFLKPKLMEAWGLEEWHAELLGSLFFVGFFVALFVTGPWADRSGRRTVILLSMTAMLASSCATFLVNSFWAVAATRTLAGVATSGAFNGIIVLAMEQVPRSYRVTTKSTLSIFWEFSLLLYAGIAYLLREHSWRTLVAVNGFTMISLILNATLLTESPRYLLSHGSEPYAAEAALVDIARRNRIEPYASDPSIGLNFQLQHNKLAAPGGERPFLQLWKRSLVVQTLAIGLAQMAGTMSFYGLTFSDNMKVSENQYLSSVYGGLSEIPGILVTWAAADLIGRRTTYSVVLTTLGLALLGTYFYPNAGMFSDALVLIGRFSAAGATMVCYVCSAETFPTDCRSAGVAWGSSCGRLGAIIAPITIEHKLAKPIYAGVNLVAAVTTLLFIPETRTLEMSDS